MCECEGFINKFLLSPPFPKLDRGTALNLRCRNLNFGSGSYKLPSSSGNFDKLKLNNIQYITLAFKVEK